MPKPSSSSHLSNRPTVIEELELRRLLSVSAQNLGVYTDDLPANGVSVKGIYYFSGRSASTVYDQELWRSDGTPQGTFRVKDIFPGTRSSSPEQLTDVHGTLFFEATDGAGYPGIFKSDGTDAGTVLVHRFTYLRDGGPSSFCASGDRLFFTAVDPLYGRELWVSDGTDPGTHMVRDIDPGTTGSDPGYLYAFDNKVFFQAFGPNDIGNEAFVSDGTYDGTFLLKDIDPGTANGYPNWWHEAGGKLFFSASTAQTGFELWTTDGTPTGTKLVKDIIPGSADSYVHPVLDYNGFLYSVVSPLNSPQQLWKTDPATGATTLVKDAVGGVNGPAYTFTVIGNKILFNGFDSSHGDELWVSDGTGAGTHRLSDINPGTGNGVSDTNVTANGWDFFVGNDGIHGNELWASDGATTAGTFMVADARPGSSGSEPFWLTTSGSNVFFTPLTGANPNDPSERGLWVATATTPPTPPPTTGGSIGGTVYDDANGNANRDVGEAGVAGITVYNDANNNVKLDAGELTTVTDANGAYTFAGLSSSSYKIRQILQSGWAQTTPANNYGWTITLASNQNLTGKDFGTTQSGVTPPPTGGSIAGVIYNDANNNAKRDAGELGVAGMTVYNDANNNSKLDAGEKTTVTDANGTYLLSGLAAGSYKIREILQSGWSQTTPAKNYGWTITLATNQNLTAKDFGTKDNGVTPPPPTGGSIAGVVWNDLDGDRVKDSNEVGVGNITIYNDANNNSKLDAGELTTTTDGSGVYTLANLSAGSYKIREILQSGWSQTTPTNNYGWTITLATNQQLTGKNFGTKQSGVTPPPPGTASISGFTFNDNNANGVFDGGDVKTGGKTVFLDTNNNGKLDSGEKSVVSDTNGNWSFSGLVAGTYHVRRVFPSGYTYSTTLIDLTLNAGDNDSGLLIGSEKIG